MAPPGVAAMPTSFLDELRQHGIHGPLPRMEASGPTAQGIAPGTSEQKRAWDFAFATGVESSNPVVMDANGNRLRRDLLTECGHLEHWREDLQLVKDLGTPCLRYGLPNHLIHLGADHFDWSL